MPSILLCFFRILNPAVIFRPVFRPSLNPLSPRNSLPCATRQRQVWKYNQIEILKELIPNEIEQRKKSPVIVFVT